MAPRRLPARRALPQLLLPAANDPNPGDAAPSGPAALSVVAHELRAPLHALALGTELLVDQLDELDPDQVRERVALIGRRTLALQRLIENLLSASSLAAGRFHV